MVSYDAMTRWHPLEPADDEFFTSAPHVFRYQKRFAATPEQVRDSLTSDESLAAWGPMIKKVTWTSPRPFGVGTTREVNALGSSAHERYFRWDEGHSHAFCDYEAAFALPPSGASPRTTSSPRMAPAPCSHGPWRSN
jgi:hypothetical protein